MTNDIDTLLAGLAKLWPHAFCYPPRPLQIGIFEEIMARADIGADALSAALERWVSAPAYLLRCSWPGIPRYGLDGSPVGCVTKTEAEWMLQKLVIKELGWRPAARKSGSE
jgi:sRNA-binding protein